MGKRFNDHDYYEDEFKTLESYGLKKGKVARLSKSKKSGIVKKLHTNESIEEMSRKELLAMAHEHGIEASARTSKKDLIEELKKII
ncbi:MAG: Rho termination factor N-terminal domain-containing protein [Cyclobacteriaceae bacterium]